ncbi:hypothetical protein FRX31_008878 [Thalictrum thalictroides]|uniref:Uncharacterized protein n=1 Tax=Thalictrum thalictroides TaxID=46969 RepID=A0A7J6WVT9_THATH|nr:hypothetical protein FRX31_008878 [Thalictrum thalictroides]
MKESVFHHYILESLSGPPLNRETDMQRHNHNMAPSKSMPSRLRYLKKSSMKSRTGSRKIDMEIEYGKAGKVELESPCHPD